MRVRERERKKSKGKEIEQDTSPSGAHLLMSTNPNTSGPMMMPVTIDI